jgi:solute carrier family 25 oxoglutarate transporter 11
MQTMVVTPGVAPPYAGMVDCARKSVAVEGAAVLWAGFTPAFIKLAPYSIIALTTLDSIMRAYCGEGAI